MKQSLIAITFTVFVHGADVKNDLKTLKKLASPADVYISKIEKDEEEKFAIVYKNTHFSVTKEPKAKTSKK